MDSDLKPSPGAGVAEVDFLSGDSEMAARLRAMDWTRSSLGSPRHWPQNLRMALRIMLASRQPIWVGWGPELTYFYNDAYKSIIGGKHPWALGRPISEVWREIWNDIGPMLDTALRGERGTYVESQLLIMERNGYPEETYYTFSYSPIPNDDGTVGGIFCANTDETQRVIGERQLALLRDISASTVEVRSWREVLKRSAQVFEANSRDLPFVLMYMGEAGSSQFQLQAAHGFATGHPAAPDIIGSSSADPWPVGEVLASRELRVQEIVPASTKAPLPSGPWDRPPVQAAVIPLPLLQESSRVGVLIVGLNPFRLFDHHYRSFLTLVAGQIAAALASTQAYEDAQRRAEALAEIDRAKTLFFSNVSHELRTPLTLMLGPIEDASRHPGTPATVRRQLELAHRNSLRLLKLVNTLLDFSRIEAGRAQAAYEPLDLAALTRDLASTFRSALERAGLVLEVDCSALPAPVYVDREMWEKIVLNLLSNAFKYTLEGTIAVRLYEQGAQAVLEVRDTGAGIPEREMPRLFERFHRIEGTIGRTQEGSGIGLALIHELVQLHKGHIQVQSEVGRGTTFQVFVPLGTSHLPAQHIKSGSSSTPAIIGAQPFVQEALRWIPDDSAGAIDLRPVAASDLTHSTHQGAFGAGARVVLADDNADMRMYVSELLAPFYRVEAVNDGVEALEAARREPPDLILSDIMMPRMDGLALLKAIRADSALINTPVVLLSARAGEEARLGGLEAGADDYLVKPFSARELLARVGVRLELRRMRQESDELFRAYVSATTEVVYRMSPDWSVMRYLNGQGFVADVYDPTSEWLEMYIHPDDRAHVQQAIASALETASIFQLEHRVRRVNGSYGWTLSRAIPLRNHAGEIIEWFGTASDVTPRREVAEALQQRSAQYETLLNRAPLGVYLVDADFRLSDINPTAHQVFGNIPDLLGRDFREVIHLLWSDSYAEEIVSRFHHTLATGESFQTPERAELRRDHHHIEYYEWHVHKIMMPGGRHGVVCYFRDISAQVHARQELERADRQKDEFLAMLAHELRNPLAPIMNASEILSRTIEDNSQSRAAVDMVKRQVSHLTRLVDDLLEVSRITRGRIELKPEPLEINAVVAQALETLSTQLRQKQHQVISVPSNDPLYVNGDFTRLVQCLVNVIGNASKYTEPRGEIRIGTRAEAQNAVIEVSDNGAGIPPALLPQIFDLFVQGDRTLDRAQGGLGIGLSVVKQLVQMHGGHVSARSSGAGSGSVFEIELPRIERPATIEREVVSTNPGPLRVLIVDDNADAAESLAMLLEMRGHQPAVAHNAVDALELVTRFNPDIAFVDIGLPQMNGYELGERLRAHFDQTRLTLVALTGYGQAEDRQRSRRAGFDEHLVKPVDLADVEVVLANARRGG